MSQPDRSIVSRRSFVAQATGLAALISVIECEQEKSIPTFTIKKNGEFNFIDASKLTTASAGVERIIIASLSETDETAAFVEFSDNVKQELSQINQVTTRRNGFVPFDSSFSVEKAMSRLQEQYQIKSAKTPTAQESSVLNSVFRRMSSKKGLAGIYDTPPYDTDVMFVLGASPVYTINGKQPPDVIVKARLRFTKNGLTY